MACYFDVSSAVFATKQGPAATAWGLAFRRTAILRSPGGRLPLLDIRHGIVGGPVAFPALVGGLPIRQAVSGGIFAVIYEIFTFF